MIYSQFSCTTTTYCMYSIRVVLEFLRSRVMVATKIIIS